MENKSFLLKVNSNENIKYLEKAGYTNAQNISFDGLRVKVLVVDELSKVFYATNVTCLAAFNGKGNILNFEEFKVINEVNNNCSDLEC